MPPRLIVHAGFHKTGTSSVQQMLRRGKRPLRPVLRALTKRDMPAMCEAARAYAQTSSPVEMALFAYETAQVFEALDPADARCVLLSSEDLSGHIPGRRKRLGYPAAPRLMAQLLETVGAVWGAAPEVIFYFSTRAPEAWMRSCYAQHLRATRMTDDLATYMDWQRPQSDLSMQVAAIAAAVPSARVEQYALEDTRDLPHGPVTPLLDLAGVPQHIRDKLPPPAIVNAALPEPMREALRLLNASIADSEELSQRKQALIAAAHHGKSPPNDPVTD